MNIFTFNLFNNILLILIIIIICINIADFLIKYKKLTVFIIIIFNKSLSFI